MMTPTIEVRMPGGELKTFTVSEWSIEEDFLGPGKVYTPTKVDGLPPRTRLVPVIGTDARYLLVQE